MQREFFRLDIDLQNFVRYLCGLKQLERPGEPEVDLPTMQQTIDQIHAALGHPRVSAKERKRLEDEKNAAASLENMNVERTKTPDTDA